MLERLQQAAQAQLEAFRLRVSRPDALPELSFLGVIAGLLAGVVIIAFRLVVEGTQSAFLTAGPGDYEHLAATWRLLLPIAGGLIVGLLFQWIPDSDRRVGVAHIMERLAYYQGRMPVRNAVVQLVGGAVSIITGQSIGREGPSVHLGAAGSNLPAQALGLPHNSLRVIAACGTAAGIAASFNTPLAGVAFAMEVLMMEYTVAAFAPVILATVGATILTRLVYGSAHVAYHVPPLSLGSMLELPYIIFVGAIVGVLAGLFIHLVRLFTAAGGAVPPVARTTLAGLAVGVAALGAPQVMGIGDDTVNAILLGHLGISLLFTIVLLKLLVSTAAVGLGIPGGMIGPSLFIGAAAGGIFGLFAEQAHIASSSSGLYALIGMGAMMAGILQAPLAALLAMLELTGNPNIIFPGMLAVITATLISGRVYGRESVFLALMRARGLDYRNDPIAQSLRRMGVAAAMDRSFTLLPRRAPRERIDEELRSNPRWVLIRDEEETPLLLAAVDLARALTAEPQTEVFDLLTIPATRLHAAAVDMRDNLQEALELMERTGAEALYVSRIAAPGIRGAYGILTREEIERSYRY
jgi:CIC family chloride channel protein